MEIIAIIYITLEAIIGVLAILGNALVLIAIYKYPRLKTITNCFIASLALADLLVGIIVAPLAALSYLGLPEHFIGCVFTNSLVIMFTQISIFNLLAVAIERFIAIKYPFTYQNNVTMKRALAMIVVAWCIAILIGLIPVFGWNLGPTDDGKCSFVGVIGMDYMVYFNFFVCVLVPLVTVFAIYIYIFCIVKQQMAKISALEIVQGDEDRNRRKHFKREIKAAKSLAFVIGLFALSWLPIHMLNTLTFLCGEMCTEKTGSLLLCAILLSHCNSFINPVLYAYGNSKFRLAFRRMLCNASIGHGLSRDEDYTATTVRGREKNVIMFNNTDKGERQNEVSDKVEVRPAEGAANPRTMQQMF